MQIAEAIERIPPHCSRLTTGNQSQRSENIARTQMKPCPQDAAVVASSALYSQSILAQTHVPIGATMAAINIAVRLFCGPLNSIKIQAIDNPAAQQIGNPSNARTCHRGRRQTSRSMTKNVAAASP